MIAARVSINIPTINKRTVISKMMTIEFVEIDNNPSAISPGICSIVNKRPNALAVPTMISTVAVVKAESMITLGSSLNFNSR